MNATAPVLVEQDAFKWCRDVTKKRARNFYYGLKLLPEPRRSAMYAIYAWMRHADDLIDDQGDPGIASALLDEFAENTRQSLEGVPPAPLPMWKAFTETVSSWSLDPAPFGMMIDGQRADLEGREINTPEDLLQYCRQVASSVGLVCIQVWGATDQLARDLAIDRGIAFQLTNILRDLKEDLEMDRCYLPSEQLQAAGLTPESLLGWIHGDRCESLVRGWIDMAHEAYGRSAPLDELIDPECRPTLWAMTSIYRSILDRIDREPMRIAAGPRVRLGAAHKTSIALRARWMARGG